MREAGDAYGKHMVERQLLGTQEVPDGKLLQHRRNNTGKTRRLPSAVSAEQVGDHGRLPL